MRYNGCMGPFGNRVGGNENVRETIKVGNREA